MPVDLSASGERQAVMLSTRTCRATILGAVKAGGRRCRLSTVACASLEEVATWSVDRQQLGKVGASGGRRGEALRFTLLFMCGVSSTP